MNESTLNIGMLGAARIGKWGMVQPCAVIEEVQLHAIAARSRDKAEKYARRHHIGKVHNSYEDLLADDQIDAIYNPLPNSLHCEWSIKALEAGKHVLCEKPIANNAVEAEQMRQAAVKNQRVLMEAFHYRYHPVATYMRDAVSRLGHIKQINTSMCVPFIARNDIRYEYDLGGGATMDVGAYSINLLRLLAEAADETELNELPEIIQVDCLKKSEKIDRALKADLRWANGTRGHVHHSLWSSSFMNISVHVVGELGELKVLNPVLPHAFNWCRLTLDGHTQRKRIRGESTYSYQLREFIKRVRVGHTQTGDLDDAVANMTLIDALYRKAGMPVRGT